MLRRFNGRLVQDMVTEKKMLSVVASVYNGEAALACVIMAVYAITARAGTGAADGSAAIAALICFMFSVLFLLLGFTGIYISALLREIKQRPIYIVEEKINFKK